MELDHASHRDHKLTYKKSVKRGKKAEDCAACCDEISSEHYSCSECDFFIHKLCAERPQEISHSLHPLHPLHLLHKNPYDEGYGNCDACKTGLEGFIYHCAICQFDLDFICAFPDGLKLNYLFHPEHVLTFEKTMKRSDKGLVCVACLEEISGQPAGHYSCRRCNVFLHKLCSEAPLELTHSDHTHYPLRLEYTSINILCDACGDLLDGVLYDCTRCSDFKIHLGCAVPTLKPDYSAFPGGTKLNHVCHRHILALEKALRRADKRLVCAACLEGISADYYSCRKCNFFLHKSCGERPKELLHSLHPEHTLHLLQQYPNYKGSSACPSCQKTMKGFVYNCQDCRKFGIDLKCAFPKLEKRIQNLEQVHNHPLTFIPRPSKISCDLCSSAAGDEGEEEESYVCSTCDFVIHKSCALTKLTQRYKEHGHPLSLVQGVPEDLQIYGAFFCDVCHSTVTSEDSVAHCAPCRYFVHVSCMITGETGLISSIKDDVDYLQDSLIQLVLSGDDFVHWPQSDVASELIQPFLLGKNGIVMNALPKIRHFSHEEHDMILFQELSVNNDGFFVEEDEEILCNACIHPITAPYYCCQACNYYLHLPCANLPSKISHSSHRHHELYLGSQSRCYNYSKCGRCQLVCNGFFYVCDKCEFSLDLTCAALPAVIIHESHEHPLFQSKQEYEGLCYCCNGYDGYGDGIFKCRSCEVYLHYNCAMYSRSIRHRWDRQHPLELRYPPHSGHPDHIMCDMCEELVHPMRWLFSCFKCKVSFHTDCAPKYHQFPNIKYGGKVKIFHPHILKYLRIATLKITCDKCEAKLDPDDVFECETCYYCICSGCVRIEDEEIQISDLCHEGLKLLFGEVGDE